MKVISRAELQDRIDRRAGLKLVFVLGDWQYRNAHIPGSVNVPCTPDLFASDDALAGLGQEDEIVVYCSNESCYASISVGYLLDQRGYRNVSRYAGGLQDWYEAGLPLAGEMS
jgi:rhodanese-related sulfurtransferase